jgi:hypothetical protein
MRTVHVLVADEGFLLTRHLRRDETHRAAAAA